MNNRIRTYKDLCEEKARLEFLLQQQKGEFKSNLNALKENFSPLVKLGSAIGVLTTRSKSYPLLNIAAGILITSLIKKKLLARAGWLTRLLVPFFMKNVSSHVIKRQGRQLFAKVGQLLKKD